MKPSWTASRASSWIAKDQPRGGVQARHLRAGERFEGVMIAPLRPFDQVPLIHDRLVLAATVWPRDDGMASPSRESFRDMETRSMPDEWSGTAERSLPPGLTRRARCA